MTTGNYQRVRLWAGITSIGTNLAIIWALAISAKWWAVLLPSSGAQWLVLVMIAVGIALANLPFDVLSGHAVETACGRTNQSFRSWLVDWLSGRAIFIGGLVLGFLFFWFNFLVAQAWSLPLLGFALLLGAVQLLFVPGGKVAGADSGEKSFEMELSSELKALGVGHRMIQWFDNGDVDSVNGYIRVDGTLCLAGNVARQLQPREAALMAAREEWFRRSSVYQLTYAIVLGWLIVGVAAALWYPATTALEAALGGSAVVTTWCFLALFVWPSLNRYWMKRADHFLCEIAPRGEVCALFEKIQKLNATDVDLPPGKTTVFHPIPPLTERLKSLL